MKGITFNELTLRDKANLVNELGCYLLSIESYNHLIHLYSLDTHLIEVYHLPGSRQIDAISLANFHDLDKYVACIAIANMGIVR